MLLLRSSGLNRQHAEINVIPTLAADDEQMHATSHCYNNKQSRIIQDAECKQVVGLKSPGFSFAATMPHRKKHNRRVEKTHGGGETHRSAKITAVGKLCVEFLCFVLIYLVKIKSPSRVNPRLHAFRPRNNLAFGRKALFLAEAGRNSYKK